ncbi:MAG: mechanosensitive ion channel family protein [Arenicellales bacterium]
MFESLLPQLQPYLSIIGAEPWKQAALIVVVFFVAAWILGFLINSIIGLFTHSTKNVIDEEILRHLRRPLIWSLFMMGLVYAGNAYGFSDSVMGIVRSVLLSIAVMLWSSFAVRAVKLMFSAIIKRADEHSLVRKESLPLFNNLSAILIYAAATYFIFQAWGVDMTAWLASAGVIGIAVGFAAKDTLANLFSGVFIMADSPYKIGDYVVLDDNLRGKITHIGIRSTRMLTRDDVEVTVPNSIMGNSKIINQSGGPHLKFRIRVNVSVAYGSDTEQVEQALLDEAAKQSLVCKYPTPRVRFRHFGDSGLSYELLCWIDEPELRGRALHYLNTGIYNAFIDAGIEIPFNKQDIYIKEMPKK